jgi:hypothetical protein
MAKKTFVQQPPMMQKNLAIIVMAFVFVIMLSMPSSACCAEAATADNEHQVISAGAGALAETSDTSAAPVPDLKSISLKPKKLTVIIGTDKTVQFIARGDYSDHTVRDISASASWSSSDEKVATVDASGLVTVGAQRGTITITARFQNKRVSARLTVKPPQLLSLSIDPVKPSIAKGMTQQFIAMGTFSDNTTRDLTSSAKWESYNTQVAEIDPSGRAVGKARRGAATITATYGLTRGSTKIIMNPRALVSISVTPGETSVVRGVTQQFIVTGKLADNTTQDLTSVASLTSDPKVAKISERGLATAVAHSGRTTITASYKGKTGFSSLIVVPQLVSVTILPANKTIQQMDVQQFKAVGTFEDNSTVDLTSAATWSSGAPSVAPISASGQVAGVATGSSKISITYEGKSDSTQVTVLLREIKRPAVADPAKNEIGKAPFQWPVARFTNPDSTTPETGAGDVIVDQLTGLMWTTEARTPGPAACAPAVTKTWQDALLHVECLNATNYLGYNDWRLPNRKELFSLIDYEQSVPRDSVYSNGFSYVQQHYGYNYWLTSPSNAAVAVVADMSYGTVYYSNKQSRNYLWPVRGGEDLMHKPVLSKISH